MGSRALKGQKVEAKSSTQNLHCPKCRRDVADGTEFSPCCDVFAIPRRTAAKWTSAGFDKAFPGTLEEQRWLASVRAKLARAVQS